MATVKVKFRSSSVEERQGTLYYQIIHDRKVRQIGTGYRLYPAEWDSRTSCVRQLSEVMAGRRDYLASLRQRVECDTVRLQSIMAHLAGTGKSYTADKVVELFRLSPGGDGFISFGRKLVTQLHYIGKARTAEAYTTSLNSFERFRGVRADIALDGVDASLMMEYESYLREHDVCPNSSSYYMRNLRAIFNRAADRGLTAPRNPFKHVYTGIDKTVKRALPIEDIRRIRDLDLMLDPSMELARNLFMFSFYTRGMSFVDMAYLKKKDLHNGILSYRRRKTNQQMFVRWESPMQEIVDKYDTADSPYLLPIIKDRCKDARRQYKSAEHLVNAKLKKIGKLLGLTVPLTTYVARHGWASIAKSREVSVSVISEAMGHSSEDVTQIYLASLDASLVVSAFFSLLPFAKH